MYGVDWDGPAVVENDDIRVEVPHTPTPLSLEHMATLERIVDPLEECEDHGVSLYNITRTFVNACL